MQRRPTSTVAASLSLVITVLCCPAAAEPAVTFTRSIAPILYEECDACHRPGQIAPFSLLTYADARPRAAAIARAVRTRTMPPWKPDAGSGVEFAGSRRLSDAQIAAIQAWVDDGAAEGDPADLPPAPTFPDGWRLGTPDLVITLPEPYVVPSDGADLLRNFVLPIAVDARRYVTAIEFHPGNARVVHHANLRIDRTGTARALDAADPAPGFDGRLTAGDFPDGYFLGWTPGQLPPKLAAGMAWPIEPGSDLVVQLHLHPADTTQSAQPAVGLFFTDLPPTQVPVMLRLGRQNIDIPAGASRYEIEDSYTLPVDATLTALQPHAHYRAREVSGAARLPDGSRRQLLSIRDWDFNWQDVYRLASPLPLPRGTTIAMRVTYDNSAANVRNPDRPPKRIRWGQNSTDEMGDLWFQVLTRTPEDRRRLVADFGPKVMAEDAAGYETLLAADPKNARLHQAAGEICLALGQRDRAITHFLEALRSEPESVEAHYNLGLALASARRSDEAAREFTRTIAIDPGHLAARVNLGAVLRAQGRLDEAAAALRDALARDPRNAAAHANLAGVLASTGALTQAIGEYRKALDANPDLLEPLTSLAWIHAAAPAADVRRPDEAVRLAERAATLAPREDIRARDTLAVAYAAAGDFERALSEVEGAIRTATDRGLDADRRALQSRAALYRRHVAYRDPAVRERPTRP